MLSGLLANVRRGSRHFDSFLERVEVTQIMAPQLMFYEKVAPVSPQRHGNWSIEAGADYDFARKVNSVPLAAIEIPHAAREYTVVFAQAGPDVVPVVILGVKNDENLYVTEDGKWHAKYIPAFVRRYPFVFSPSEDGKTLRLCVDESWKGCNQEGRGQALFDEKGERTPFLERLLGFLQDYQQNAQRTKAYTKRLQDLGLLEMKTAQFTLGDQKMALQGFMAVNRDKLKELPPETLQEMAKTNELELTYAHLLSMNNLQLMLERIAAARKGIDPTPEVPAPGPTPAEEPES